MEHALPCCMGRSNSMDRFMEICLYLLLSEQQDHGYSLAQRLAGFGFDPNAINMGAIYRTLRRMEREGSVRSIWTEGGQGPKKRVYLLTEEGVLQLEQWVEVLRHRRTRIDTALRFYEEDIQ
jgi:PadR family transcriptional regulator PadR